MPLLLLAVLAGCIQQTVIYHDSSPKKILAAISSAIAENDILSTIAQIDLVTIHGYYPARAVLIIKKPSYLRLELFPVIGTPDFFLAASPEKMSIFLPSKGEFYYGKPTSANLERFLPWQFNIDDIVMIFAGTYPSLKEKVIDYQSYQERNFLRIEMTAQSGCSQIIWVGENNRLLKLVRKDEYGKEIYNVKYDHYEKQSPVAGEITISMADGITSLSIKYSDLKIEKATDLSIFNLQVPANVRTIPLD
jgi:hypothetical protein